MKYKILKYSLYAVFVLAFSAPLWASGDGEDPYAEMSRKSLYAVNVDDIADNIEALDKFTAALLKLKNEDDDDEEDDEVSARFAKIETILQSILDEQILPNKSTAKYGCCLCLKLCGLGVLALSAWGAYHWRAVWDDLCLTYRLIKQGGYKHPMLT